MTSAHLGSGFDDLAPLAEVVAGADVIGLGESTHGSGSEFEMKTRLFEWLAVESGFGCLAIERDIGDASIVDRFVQGRDEALELSFSMTPWRTKELETCLRWMRSSANPVRFAGFDCQVESTLSSIDAVHAFFTADGRDALDGLLAPVQKVLATFEPPPSDLYKQAVEAIETIGARIDGVDTPEARWAAHNLNALRQGCALRAARADDRDSGAMRDGFMAENIAWLVENTPGAGVAVWAHNGHVLRKADAMGGALGQRFGDRYLAVGFAFHDGTYSTYLQKASGGVTDFVEVEATPSRPGSIEWLLHRVGIPMFAVDLRPARADGPALLREAVDTRVIGVGGPEQSSYELEFGEYHVVIPEAFDVMVYIERSTPSKLLASLFDGVPEGL